MSSPFRTTSWSLISRTREPGEAAREATESLCRLYWQPLYCYARRAGQSGSDAEDTVQEFLLHVVEHDVFARADADRGRFRTFLLSALKQFMARRRRDAQRLKRAPDSRLLSLDVVGAERMLDRSGAPNADWDLAFERAWALALLDIAWRVVEEDYAASGKSAVFGALRPVIGGEAGRPIREVAAELNMTEGAANVAAHRLRRRFGEALREQIALTLESADDVDDEVARMKEALAGV